ncbi:MAG: hypothetical protein WCJ35_21255 [Planctomycetota bacterium]
MNLSTLGKVTRCINGVVAGQATTTGTAIDMKGYSSVTFYCLIGAIASTGTVTLKAQQSSDDAATDAYADLLGTAIAYTDADDNKVAILEIVNPQKRYIKPILITATANGVIDGVIAVQTKAKLEPVTHSTTVLSSKLKLAPAAGTA